MAVLLSRVLSHPLVAKVLIPSLAGAISLWLERRASEMQLRAAVNVTKAAKSAEELRRASERLRAASSGV